MPNQGEAESISLLELGALKGGLNAARQYVCGRLNTRKHPLLMAQYERTLELAKLAHPWHSAISTRDGDMWE